MFCNPLVISCSLDVDSVGSFAGYLMLFGQLTTASFSGPVACHDLGWYKLYLGHARISDARCLASLSVERVEGLRVAEVCGADGIS